MSVTQFSLFGLSIYVHSLASSSYLPRSQTMEMEPPRETIGLQKCPPASPSMLERSEHKAQRIRAPTVQAGSQSGSQSSKATRDRIWFTP